MLSLIQAERIADGIFAYRDEHDLKPLTVMVLDAAGVPILFKRPEGSPWIRYDVAFAKAWGCLAMGLGGRAVAQRAATAPGLFSLVNAFSAGKVADVPGGVLVRDEALATLGAVGVSGDHPDNDERAAVAGCARAGLHGETGA